MSRQIEKFYEKPLLLSWGRSDEPQRHHTFSHRQTSDRDHLERYRKWALKNQAVSILYQEEYLPEEYQVEVEIVSEVAQKESALYSAL